MSQRPLLARILKLRFSQLKESISRKELQRKLRNFGYPYRLHLGCGRVRLEGWVNIDSDPNLAAADISWDLGKGIPFNDNACEFIYCEHFLEHFTVEEGLGFLRECHRVLKADGVLRVAMPSLDVLIEKSYRGNWRDQDWLTWPEYQFIETRAEMFNISFRWWGHKWLYDLEELHRRLKEAGFSQIRDVDWGTSNVPELRDREMRKDSLLICEAVK